MADVQPLAELRSSHEQLVRDFLASCDPERVAEVEALYPVLDKGAWMAIDANERDARSFDNLTEVRRPSGVVVRVTQAARRRIPITSRDQCQVCGSYDARCECCG